MKQIDMFGNEVDAEIIEAQLKPIHPNKYKTMQQLHGVLACKTCKTCKHLIKRDYHNKTYYKCELWYQSNSSATDIRLKNIACRKHESRCEE